MRLTLDDLPFVMQFTTDEAGWDDVSDDFTRNADREAAAIAVLMDPQTICLTSDWNGLFIFQQRTTILYEGHFQLLPSGRGKAGFRAGDKAVRWMFESTPCQKIIGFTPADNKIAVLFALKMGFKIEGRCTRSWMHNGVLHDQIITGLGKTEWAREVAPRKDKERKRWDG